MPYLTYLAPRNPLADAKDTVSSWDKCMAKSYCKWPVIVAIVVGSLIILSVVFCVARCICCGADVACCCFKCCTCCCGGSSKKHKRMASEPPPPPGYGPGGGGYVSSEPARIYDSRPLNQQYRSHPTPAFNPEPERPQYARFETQNKPVNEDALPSMPTWSEATSTKVQVEETALPEKQGDVEMDRLDYNGSVAGGAAAMGAARRSPARSPVQRSPAQDSYGFPAGYQNDSFVGGGAARRSPGPQGAQYAHGDGYRGMSPVHTQSPVHAQSLSPVHAQSISPVYGAGAGYATTQQPYGRRSPNAPYDQAYNPPAPNASYDPYDGPAPPPNPAYNPYDGPAPPPGPGSPEYGSGPTPEASTGYAYGNPPARTNAGDTPYQNLEYDAPIAIPSPSVGYAPSGSTRFEPTPSTAPAPAPSASPAPAAYPGQQSYGAEEHHYPGQQTYHAYAPAGQAPQGEQFSGVQRKAVDGSWKEV